MKAIVVRERGGPEVLRYEDVPDPVPGEGQVLVRVRASGVNFGDILLRTSGYFGTPLPAIPGIEAAGIVEAIGPGVQGLRPGDRVAGRVLQGYAELAVAPAATLFPLPAELSFEQGAAIPVAFVTAWHALFTKAGLRHGDRVLVHAAGSGVGSAAIQLAKQFGGWVIATAGADWKLELARKFGADATINYQTGDFAEEALRLTDGRGVDIVLENVGAATFAGSVKSLATYGRLVVIGAPSGGDGRLSIWDVIAKRLTISGISMARSPETPRTLAEVRDGAIPLFVEGRLQAIVARTLPLREAPEAHRLIERRELFGKIVLTP